MKFVYTLKGFNPDYAEGWGNAEAPSFGEATKKIVDDIFLDYQLECLSLNIKQVDEFPELPESELC